MKQSDEIGDITAPDFRETAEFENFKASVAAYMWERQTVSFGELARAFSIRREWLADALDALKQENAIRLDTSNPMLTRIRAGGEFGEGFNLPQPKRGVAISPLKAVKLPYEYKSR